VLGSNGVAASLCRNYPGGGYADWFLPSQNELVELYKNRYMVGGLATKSYWSSTEIFLNSIPLAYAQNFWGYQGNGYKSDLQYVRAVRAF
jgi:hypothetical protein